MEDVTLKKLNIEKYFKKRRLGHSHSKVRTMNCCNKRPFQEGPCNNTNESCWNHPVSVDQIASLFKKNISRNENTRKIVKNHSQKRNLFVLDEKPISRKERKAVNPYIIMLFEAPAIAINFRGDDRNLISVSL